MRASDHAKVWQKASDDMGALLKTTGELSKDEWKLVSALQLPIALIAQAYREEAERNPE